jgi:hypothetical protein
MSDDFNRLRDMGFKAIVRVAYNKDEVRPFKEPSKEQILAHVSQLKPLFHTHRDVNDDWVDQGCITNIIQRLGYRLQLVSSSCTDEARPGHVITAGLTVRNLGYAAFYNRRGIELILRNTDTAAEYYANLSDAVDPRFWLPGSDHAVSAALYLPESLPTGTYHLLLHLPRGARAGLPD